MKKGRKPNPEAKKAKIIAKLWTSLCLDLRVLEEFQLFNQYYPESKQIFVKQAILQKKQQGVRFVKKNYQEPLIDCRTIREKQRQGDKLEQQKQTQEQNPYDSFISSGMSVICINEQFNQPFIEKTKTAIQGLPESSPQPNKKLPRYLQFEPSTPSSPSLSIIQPLTKSFVQKLMDDDDYENDLNWSLSNISVLQQSIEQTTFTSVKDLFPNTNQKQYEQLLQAYGHNYQIIQTLLKTNPKQIQILLDKYQKM